MVERGFGAGLWMLLACFALAPLVAGCDGESGSGPGVVDSDAGTGPGGGQDAGWDTDLDGGGTPLERPSGMVADVRFGDPLVVDEGRRGEARQAFEDLDKADLEEGFSPEALAAVFNEFVLTHFGMANQPLLSIYTGDLLDFQPSGSWIHVGRNSAAIAFETTLPAITTVEFGTSEAALESSTEETSRYFFHHLHHVRGLEPETTYYYRLVARGDDGETILSHVESFTTTDGGGAMEIPGAMEGPPYVLDQPGDYVLTEDLVADGTVVVLASDAINLDLNGHRIVYADSPRSDVGPNTAEEAASGVWGRSGLGSVRIVNGLIEEGHVGNRSTSNGGLNPIYVNGATDVEITGVAMSYHAAQINALFVRYPSGVVSIHHNRFEDRGFQVLDRHGSGGGRPLRLIANDPTPGEVDPFEVTHNLVVRTRQNGLMRAQVMEDNEVYVDSWATNSFAIQPFSRDDQIAGSVRRNKVFLTGYNAIGFGWAHLDLTVAENLVMMEGVSTARRRYDETWGEMDSTSAFRITNYGSGGQVRENLVYEGNVVLGRARGGGVMRGTMFFTDLSIEGTRVEGNRAIVDAADEDSLDTTPVVAQGVYANRDEHRPAYYIDNHIASNVANIRFGDSYGRGNRHIFIRPVLERRGEHPQYHTIVFDAGFHSGGHRLVDPVLEGGAAYDDVWWRRTSVQSYYTVAWTLTLEGSPGAAVTIEDAHGDEVFAGEVGSDGTLEVALDAVTIRPAEWEEGGPTFEVQERLSHQKIWHTPHVVDIDGESFEVDVADGR